MLLERLFSVLVVIAAFLASACLFLIELSVGKQLLPRFGGAPSLWITCLAFFQLALVAAYGLADRLIVRWSPGSQVGVQAVLFAAAAAVLPLGLGSVATENTQGRLPVPLVVLVMLAASIGPAFFAVATLAPLFGYWRSRWGGLAPAVGAGRGDVAYGLYAAGNAGSFAALVAYPAVIEPVAGLASQAELAARLYGLVAVLAVACGWFAARRPPGSGPEAAVVPPRPVGWPTWLWWAGLAAVPASWLSGVTTYATVEVAPIPLLWVVPLAVYLASFVVVFSPGGRRLRRLERPAVVVAVGLAAWLLAGHVEQPVWPVIIAHLVAFFLVCVGLHGMLVDERPPADRLSSFYLALAAGGACGGMFNAVVAPAVFDAHHEFPLAIALAAAVLPAAAAATPGRRRWLIVAAPAVVAVCLAAVAPWLAVPRPAWLAVLAILLAVVLVTLRRGERGLAVAAVLGATFVLGEAAQHVIHRSRTFFGVLRVCEAANGSWRKLVHGGITHGVQPVSDDPEQRRIPLSYYAEAGPLGSVFRGLERVRPIGRVGVAGLGIGTVAAYAEPGQQFVFFEIDPEVVRIARRPDWFTFLADCRGDVRVVVDDARLALAREPDSSFDLLVIDAFTGDSVPTHLLTREALALYGRTLAPDGVVAFHVSNRYLDFVPIVERLAADGGWLALRGLDGDVPAELARSPSEWIALSRSLEVARAIDASRTSDRWRWQPCSEPPAGRPWTDDHTAVAEAVRW
jgi:SAM-dependent methyltransferase